LPPSLRSSGTRKSFWTTGIAEELAHDQLAIRRTGLKNLRNLRKIIKNCKIITMTVRSVEHVNTEMNKIPLFLSM